MRLNDLRRINELNVGAKRGSQKDARLAPGTDKPEKYMRGGEWEAYHEPQGISSKAGKSVTKGGAPAAAYVQRRKKAKNESVSANKQQMKIDDPLDYAWEPNMLPDPKDAPQIANFFKAPPGVDGIEWLIDFAVRDKIKDKAYKGDKRKRATAWISGASPSANAGDPPTNKKKVTFPIVKEQKASRSWGLRGHQLRAAKVIQAAVDQAHDNAYQNREKLDRKDVVPIAAEALRKYVEENRINNKETFMRAVWGGVMSPRNGGVYAYPQDLLKVEESFVLETDDYHTDHRPPGREDGAPAYDLTLNGIYPDDVYGPRQREYAREDNATNSFGIINRLQGKPNASVRIYRAVPHRLGTDEQIAQLEKEMAAYMRRGIVPGKGKMPPKEGSTWYNQAYKDLEKLEAGPQTPTEKMTINPGDWVTINRNYAKEHGESNLGNKYKIVSKIVKAKDIYTDGDSIHEWGYDPQRAATEATIGPLFTRGDTGTGGHGAGAVPPPSIRLPEPKIPKTKAPTKFVRKSVKKQNTDSRPVEITEMIRRPIVQEYNADYELKTDDGEETIGVASVNAGVIELLAVRDDIEADYKGQLLSRLVGSITRDADLGDANLSIELVTPEDEQMKRFLERFGFRHTGGGIMKRNAGSINPPSVVEV